MPSNCPPMPAGQVIGQTSSASRSATSSSSSNGVWPSRSTLLKKVMIGTARRRHTSNSFSDGGSMPFAALITISALWRSQERRGGEGGGNEGECRGQTGQEQQK